MRLRERSPGLWKQRGYIGIGNRRGMGGMTFRERIAALMNGSEFFAPLTHSAVPTRAASGTTGTFTRTTTETWPNNDGFMVTGVAGEIGFVGARRVRNLLTFTQAFDNAIWVKNESSGTVTITANNGVAPDGTLTAEKIEFVAPVSGNQALLEQTITVTNATVYTGTLYLKAFAAGDIGKKLVFRHAGASGYTELTLSADWQRLGSTETSVSVASTFSFGLRPAVSGSSGTVTAYVWGAQLEDVTAQTTQTAGEYVSVGVVQRNKLLQSNDLGTTPWALYNAGAVTQNALAPDGTTRAWTVTDDSAAASEGVRQSITLTAATHTVSVFVKKTVGAQSSYPVIYLDDNVSKGASCTIDTTNGTATVWTAYTGLVIVTSSASCTSYDTNYWRVSLTFLPTAASWFLYLFPAGTANATQSTGTLDAAVQGSAVFYGAQLELGSTATEYQAVGGSYIYHGSGVDGVKCYATDINGSPIPSSTLLGYQAEGARTNLCLQSNDFSNASWVKVLTPSETQNVVGPDGATSAWTLTDNSAVALEYIRQTSSALTAANYTFSVFIKKTTGAQTAYPVVQVTTGATGALCTVDTTNGVATVWTAYTGLTIVTSSASCVSHNSDYWRVSLVFLGVAATHDLYLFPACTTNATQSTGTFDVAAQASHVFYGAQVELGSFASSYIATTTLAVARNKDEESVSTSGNIEAAAGSVYLEYTPTHTPSGTVAFWGTYVDANNYTAILHDATNLIFRKRIAGVNYDATIANAFVSGTTYKACATWGTAGTSITLNGTEGTPHADTTAAQIAATMQWGADGNSSQQPFANIRNSRDWLRQLSSSERRAVTA